MVPDSNVMVGHRMPPVASSGPPRGCPADCRWPTILFAGGGPPVVHLRQMPTSDCRLRIAGGPPVAF